MSTKAASKTIVIKTDASKASCVRVLRNLASQREQWEQTEFAASNRRLYAILTDCYAYYTVMKSKDTKPTKREQYKEALEAFIKERKFRFKEGTSDMNKIVQCVFGMDRRRVSAYATALRIAYVSGALGTDGKPEPVPHVELADWLAQQGGVEEVRRAAAAGQNLAAVSMADKIDTSKQALKSRVVTRIEIRDPNCTLSGDDADKQVLLVATYRPNGKLEIHAVVKSEAAVKSALAAYYREANLSEKAKTEKARSKKSSAQQALLTPLAA